MRGKKKGGSNWEKIGWNEDKKICPFDAKKVCPVTVKPLKIAELTVDEAYAHVFIKTAPSVHHFKTSQWKDIRIDILI